VKTPLTLNNVFLVDGLGAALSALFLGGVLPSLQAWIGMPRGVLYVLAGFAALFALNACLAHRFGGERKAQWLRVTAALNLSYCALTGILSAVYFEDLEALGVAYFLGEIAVILGLVAAQRALLRGDGLRGLK